MSKHHYLKILPEYYAAVDAGRKNFEIRFHDREYKVGDILHLQEYSDGRYTGRELEKEICYMIDDPAYCKEGFAVLGLSAKGADKLGEKQIEEMAMTICEQTDFVKIILNKSCSDGCSSENCIIKEHCKILYNAGYRKQKEGEWKHTEEPMGWHDVDVAECSACGESWVIDDDLDIELILDYWHYCPNCGAHMRKEDEGK